jgi:RimJ/RimL family protein N-acetyltransferase
VHDEDSDLELKTERLKLLPIARGHESMLFPLMRDARLTQYLAWEPHASEEETARVVEALVEAQARAQGYHWVIFESGRVRGLISLIDVARRHRTWTLDRAEIAYWIDPERQGAGIATEAVSAVVDAAFRRLGLNRLRISHTSANPASGRIPQKLGFRFVGTEHEFFEKDGTLYDMNHYELLARDWRERGGKK